VKALRFLWVAGLALQVACSDRSPTQPESAEPTGIMSQQSAKPLVTHGAARVVAPRTPTDQEFAGRYLLTATDSCGGESWTGTVQMSQVGNQIGFLLGVDTGGVQGTIHGQTIDFTWYDEVDAGFLCGSLLTGVATIKGTTITGSVSGNSTANSCFHCPSETITFTLVRQ